MRSFQVAIVIGSLLAGGGVWIMVPGSPSQESYNDNIAPQQYLYIEFDIFWDGRVSGDYRETSGRSLYLHLFDTQQFLTFTTQFTAQGLYSTSGSQGTFSASLPIPGKYYIVLDHGPGYEAVTQAFSLNVKLDGTNGLILGLGIGMIAIGATVAIIGYRAKKKVESQQQPPTQGVILFDQPKPPEQPPSQT